MTDEEFMTALEADITALLEKAKALGVQMVILSAFNQNEDEYTVVVSKILSEVNRVELGAAMLMGEHTHMAQAVVAAVALGQIVSEQFDIKSTPNSMH